MSCINYNKAMFNIQGLTRLKEDSCYKANRHSDSKKPSSALAFDIIYI